MPDDRRRRSAEAALPEAVAEDRDARAAPGPSSRGSNRRPSAGRDAEHVEEIRVHHRAADPLEADRPTTARRIRPGTPSMPGEAAVPRAPVEEVRRRGVAETDCFVWRLLCDTRTRSPGRSNGSGRRSTVLTTLKMAVLAPMPIAIVSNGKQTKKPGDRSQVAWLCSERPAGSRSITDTSAPPPARCAMHDEPADRSPTRRRPARDDDAEERNRGSVDAVLKSRLLSVRAQWRAHSRSKDADGETETREAQAVARRPATGCFTEVSAPSGYPAGSRSPMCAGSPRSDITP